MVLLDDLRQRQQELRAELEAEHAASSRENLRQFAAEVHDRSEESTAETMAEMNLTLITRHELELQEIGHALRRAEQGGYGCCVDCGANIDFERLKALPTTVRCLPCQSVSDRCA